MALENTFDAAEAEARIYEAWEKADAFAAGANASRPETYSIVIPPPNVNGRLHIGHAFNNTLQDILIRWHRMRGLDTLWQPGQDHAGIALQRAVELELADKQMPTRKEMGRDAFLEYAWGYKERTAHGIVDQLKRLGASCDWDRNAFTMAGAPGENRVGNENSPNFHDAVIKTFVDFYERGIIYRGKRLVNWDPHFETAISDLEVENLDVAGHMWHFKYPLAGGASYEYVEKDEEGVVTLREPRNYISIATTRPETMLGDGAIAVHPGDERYAPIVGQLCEIPVGPKEHRRLIPIITDEYPDPAFGSGAVKITGAHDFNDYEVAKRAGIPLYRLLDTRAAMRSDGAPYADAAAVAMAVARGERALDAAEADTVNLIPDDLRGLDRQEARKAIVAQITADDLAVMTPASNPLLGKAALKPGAEGAETLVPLVEAKTIVQPFGDRSKVVIEPMLTDQWFVDTQQIVGPALDAVRTGEVEILPEQHKKVYFNWLENIEPWCISRQLWWGHQIPVWYDTEGRMYCGASFSSVAETVRTRTGGRECVEVSDAQAANELLENAAGGDSQPLPIWRDPDVLDTWFSSGLWPTGTLGWPEQTEELQKYYPTSTLVTGFDIIFFWVARMMMMQFETVKEKPFDTVYVHALVRDEKGKKMSKSVGNVIDPIDMIDEYGADALRFTLTSMAAMGRDLKLSTQRIAGYRNFGTKLWNAMRFAEMNEVFQNAGTGIPAPQNTVNKWIIGETARACADFDAALEQYRFNDAANGLYAFVWGKVCDWYLELSKPLLQDENSTGRAETQEVMAWVLEHCLTLLHPIMPFITEELWQTSRARGKMLVHADWPDLDPARIADSAADREIGWVMDLIDQIRSLRAQMHVPAGARIPLLVTTLDDAGRGAWDRNAPMIQRLARIDSLTDVDGFPKGTVTIAVQGGSFGLPLDGIIDIAEEKARLEKTLGKLGKEVGGLRGRLGNPKFAASAPAEVVAETRSNLAAREEEQARLNTALDRLKELG